MLIKLGYACISKTIENVTPSTNYTYTEYLKTKSLSKLNEIIISNLKDLNILELTPIKALCVLSELKEKIKK